MSSTLIREHQTLAEYNTMGVTAKARYFAPVNKVLNVSEILDDDRFKANRHLILGGGSNLLFLNDYDGIVLHNEIKGKEIVGETETEILIKAGGGENWHDFVLYCVENNWGGVENLSLIPGSVGAAPIQNIGAYGVEVESVVESLEAIDLHSGEMRTFYKDECNFGYRESIFKNKLKGRYFILFVTFHLQKKPEINISYRALAEKIAGRNIEKPTIRDVSDAVIEIRQSKLPDPSDIGNSGSFFKNPVISKDEFDKLKVKYPNIPFYPSGNEIKIPAAWLIDQCGWKGKRFGDAGVHEMQALVIVNYGNATGEEIWNLAKNIQNSVKEKFGVQLTPEVNVI